MYKEIFTIRIREARLKKNYTQAEVSEITGISQPIICRLESGKREPSLENLGILADLYEVSTDWLLGTGIKKRE